MEIRNLNLAQLGRIMGIILKTNHVIRDIHEQLKCDHIQLNPDQGKFPALYFIT